MNHFFSFLIANFHPFASTFKFAIVNIKNASGCLQQTDNQVQVRDWHLRMSNVTPCKVTDIVDDAMRCSFFLCIFMIPNHCWVRLVYMNCFWPASDGGETQQHLFRVFSVFFLLLFFIRAPMRTERMLKWWCNQICINKTNGERRQTSQVVVKMWNIEARENALVLKLDGLRASYAKQAAEKV